MENNDTGTDLPEGWRLQSSNWMIAKIETLHDIGSETNERMRYWRDRYLKLNAESILNNQAEVFKKLAEAQVEINNAYHESDLLQEKLNDHKEMSRQQANHNAKLRDKIEALEKEVERLKEFEWMYKDLEK